jgi:brefeldin A-inhibited guanine nucleotide-exchange protein
MAATATMADSGATGESMDTEESYTADQGSDAGPVDRFERSKQFKTDLHRGIAKFNFKPKLGLKYLESIGHLNTSNAEEVAGFLKNNEGLDKTQIGDYLGEDVAFNKEVLSVFTNLHSFAGAAFTESIRIFLSSFRLPGEA